MAMVRDHDPIYIEYTIVKYWTLPCNNDISMFMATSHGLNVINDNMSKAFGHHHYILDMIYII